MGKFKVLLGGDKVVANKRFPQRPLRFRVERGRQVVNGRSGMVLSVGEHHTALRNLKRWLPYG